MYFKYINIYGAFNPPYLKKSQKNKVFTKNLTKKYKKSFQTFKESFKTFHYNFLFKNSFLYLIR